MRCCGACMDEWVGGLGRGEQQAFSSPGWGEEGKRPSLEEAMLQVRNPTHPPTHPLSLASIHPPTHPPTHPQAARANDPALVKKEIEEARRLEERSVTHPPTHPT